SLVKRQQSRKFAGDWFVLALLIRTAESSPRGAEDDASAARMRSWSGWLVNWLRHWDASIHLERADLRGLNLRGVRLDGAHLQGANLYATDLRGASLRGAKLQDCDLTLAQLQRADLLLASLEGTSLSFAK